MRDSQRGKVYTAEQTLRSFYDHVPSGSIVVAGVPLQLEAEAKFSSLQAIQDYVNLTLLHPGVIGAFGFGSGQFNRVHVRERQGESKAHYSRRNREIAINTTGNRWAMRELVVLHELAHHFDRSFDASHGPTFTATFVTLIETVMGPQAALAMRLLQREEGAR